MLKSKRLLRAHGLATTRQRAAILKSMRERHDHPDAETVYLSLHGTMPSLSLDTVYRTLNRLAQEGLIRQLALPTHRFHFDGDLLSTDHFLCTACENIFDVEASEGALDARPEAIARIGRVQTLQRAIIGICHACDAVAEKTPPGVKQRRDKGRKSGRKPPATPTDGKRKKKRNDIAG